jgi:hypothetical protein
MKLRAAIAANVLLAVTAFAWLGWLTSRPVHTRTVVVIHQGPRGTVGARGPKGATGRHGLIGFTGVPGPPGATYDDSELRAEIATLTARLDHVCAYELYGRDVLLGTWWISC